MKEIILTQNYKDNLKNVHLRINDLDDALKFLKILSECKNLESVELRYRNSCLFDIFDDPENAIKDAVKTFYDKVGKIKSLKIYHK